MERSIVGVISKTDGFVEMENEGLKLKHHLLRNEILHLFVLNGMVKRKGELLRLLKIQKQPRLMHQNDHTAMNRDLQNFMNEKQIRRISYKSFRQNMQDCEMLFIFLQINN